MPNSNCSYLWSRDPDRRKIYHIKCNQKQIQPLKKICRFKVYYKYEGGIFKMINYQTMHVHYPRRTNHEDLLNILKL